MYLKVNTSVSGLNFATIVTTNDFKKHLYSQVCKHKLVNLSLDWYRETKNRCMNCQISSEKFLKVESFDDKFNLVMPKINRFINFSCDIDLIFWLKIWRHEWKYSTIERLKIKFSTKNNTLRRLYRKCFNLLMAGQKTVT